MKKVRIVLSGIGNRALPKKPELSNWLGWVELIRRSREFELVAAHDIADDAMQRIIDRKYLTKENVFKDLDSMLKKTQPEAILVANPAASHGRTLKKALDRNLHVLIEKPFVTDLKEGKKLIDIIRRKKLVVSVAQNWRTKGVGRLLFDTLKSGKLGKVGHIFFRYIRNRENPNYPAYIFEESFPLLYAMGIHHLDLFRHILQDEFESVAGFSFKPSWSMYKSDTGLNLYLKTRGGVSVVYSGTISSPNKGLPQESMIIEGEKGTLQNESEWSEQPVWFYPKGENKRIDLTKDIKETSIADEYNKSDEFILLNFYKAICGKEKPVCDPEDALRSIELIEASRLSCETGRIIKI